jgi:hypothetical protein
MEFSVEVKKCETTKKCDIHRLKLIHKEEKIKKTSHDIVPLKRPNHRRVRKLGKSENHKVRTSKEYHRVCPS